MSPDALRTFFRFGMWITIVALVLVLTVPRESAEFVVSVCSLGTGLALLGMVTLVSRMTRR